MIIVVFGQDELAKQRRSSSFQAANRPGNDIDVNYLIRTKPKTFKADHREGHILKNDDTAASVSLSFAFTLRPKETSFGAMEGSEKRDRATIPTDPQVG